MRSPCPIMLVHSTNVGASYDGLRQQILVATAAAEALTREELDAMIEHEKAHRELYHVERSITIAAMVIVFVALIAAEGFYIVALLVFVLGYSLYSFSRLAAEFEADSYAMKRHGAEALLGVFKKQVTAHPELGKNHVFWARCRFAAHHYARR